MKKTIADDLNFLGTFETIDEVYKTYPSGGVPGNNIIVDGIVLYWNEDLLLWAPKDNETSGDAIIDGKLTVDEVVLYDGFRTHDFTEDTRGSALRKENGLWKFSVDNINVRKGLTIDGESVIPGGGQEEDDDGNTNESRSIHAQLLWGSDSIVVDAFGNVVGGLYTEDTDGTTVVRHYKLHTGVIVYDSSKGKYLKIGDADNLGEDEFAMYVTPNGCTVLQDGADVFVTAIDNTSNGNALTDEQLDIMRDTAGFTIDFTVVTASGWRTMMTYPVKIMHLDHSYISFDLTNEMDSMSYRTQTKSYEGLPITTKLKAYANGIELSDDAFVSSTMTSNGFTGSATATNNLFPATKWLGNMSSNGVRVKLTKTGEVTISQEHYRALDMEDTKYWIDIQSVVKYAGVKYTSPAKRLTVTETTNAILYKLLLSANAVSKDEGTYTPSTIDVKVQIIDNAGTEIKTAEQMNSNGNIKVYYVNGVYDPASSELLTSMPQFSDIPVCLTVVLLDVTDNSNPLLLDIESVPMTAVGRNGAGQPWVKTNFESFFVDCDSDGKVTEDTPLRILCELYWGDSPCTLDTSESACIIQLGTDGSEEPDDIDGITATKDFLFEEGDTFSTTYVTIYLTGTADNESHNATKTIPIVANYKGVKGDDGDAGAAVRFRGVYSEALDGSGDDGYLWNGTFRDCVKQGTAYYLVNVDSDGDDVLGAPSDNNTNWENIGQYVSIATELLLAEDAVIDLLYSNVIKMRNQAGTLTATINEDQKGSYRIYYPSGNKMMEFSHEGYIYYYNDDASHTLAWKLGHGGNIDREITDDWIEFYLSPISDFNPTSGTEVDEHTDFRSTRTLYYKFMCGSNSSWAQYSGHIYESNSPRNPSLVTPVATGWYTPNQFAYENLDETGTTYAITVYHITDGVIDQELQTSMY